LHGSKPEPHHDTVLLDWLGSQLKHGWGDGFAMHPLDGGALYPRPWKKSLEAHQGMEPNLKTGAYLWQPDIRTAIEDAMSRSCATKRSDE
jgi:hypothetical protein